MIDSFATSQEASAVPPAPSASTSTRAFTNEQEVLGQERDIIAILDSGDGEVRVSVNPFGNRQTMRYNADVAVSGSGTVIWDGPDNDAGQISMGLGSRDLTVGGQNTGLAMRIGAQVAGSTARLRLYEGQTSNFSTASFSIPVTVGGAAETYQFVPFTSFVGTVSPNNVDAIALMLDANESGGNDIELALIGANGPKELNLVNSLRTDLSITKTDNRSAAIPGEPLTYTIQVANNGPSNVAGAQVRDNFPAILQNVGYTSAVSGAVSGNTPAGNGNINDTVNMSVGSTVTYTVTGTVSPTATGTITNTASVTVPPGVEDSNPANNNAVDVDTLQPEVDLRISKTDDRTTVRPGEQVTYSIVVTNQGPSHVQGATVIDNFPASLTGVTYTSAATGNASGNTPSGSGSISDLVNMAANSSINYTVRGTVAANTADTLTNTATVTAPTGVVDRAPGNNSATDIDTVLREANLSITKTNNRTEVVPGDRVNYTIVVANAGPSDVQGATVRNTFPVTLNEVSYTSQPSGNASGSSSGSGNINDVVNLPVGSSISYFVNAVVAQTASGSLTNTATITPPAGITDPVPANNTAVDTDAIDQALSSISGYVYLDRDNNGIKAADEPGISDAKIALSGFDLLQNPVQRQTTTGVDGNYQFGNLLPGTYAVAETQPAPYRDGKDTAGSGALNNPTATDNVFSNIQIGRGQQAVNFNFGELRPSFSKRDLISSAFINRRAS